MTTVKEEKLLDLVNHVFENVSVQTTACEFSNVAFIALKNSRNKPGEPIPFVVAKGKQYYIKYSGSVWEISIYSSGSDEVVLNFADDDDLYGLCYQVVLEFGIYILSLE